MCLGALLATPAAAQDAPLSAIDWLSDSVAPADSGPDVAPSAAASDIRTTALAAPPADGAGILTPTMTGFPRALWGSATVADVTARIDAVPERLTPAMRDLFRMVLLAETVPPRDSEDDRLFLTRVDRLLKMGALDDADALLRQAGAETPERFRRAFDIALLRGTEPLACRRMQAVPQISPTYPARIFCLARNGDWHAAAVTLETALTLGILSPAEDALLARFLDPEIDAAIPLDGTQPTPLTFRLMEAIGEPLPTGPLPLAFAWADLRSTLGWKAQIAAAERLARYGAIPAPTLFGLYLRRSPSADGGVWDRAAAVHALHDALNRDDLAAISEALPVAWDRLSAAGLPYVLAEQYGAELAALPLEGPAGDLAMRIGLLSPGYQGIAAPSRAGRRSEAFVLALARGVPEQELARDPMAAAVREGFTAMTPPASYRPLLDEGRIGEAILRAVTRFSEASSGELDGVPDAIALLRSLGLTAHARRAALDLLLQDGAA